ncbi:DUF397 domain-containing protein [Kitasatospora nipponensis]|uniref:DUF397 domain-containing protein n=1 Tax=Kitasatospora nipponensis TaxID=258049 RepID=A0ABN1W0K9_9ACTN
MTKATWRKSSYSDNSGACIEIADGQFPGLVPVRDSKDPAGPTLTFPTTSFAAFVTGIKSSSLRTA